MLVKGATGRYGCDFKCSICKCNSAIAILNSSNGIVLVRMPQGDTDAKSTLVQVMAWRGLATSHYMYLIQCSPRPMSSYGVTRSNELNILRTNLPLLVFCPEYLSSRFIFETCLSLCQYTDIRNATKSMQWPLSAQRGDIILCMAMPFTQQTHNIMINAIEQQHHTYFLRTQTNDISSQYFITGTNVHLHNLPPLHMNCTAVISITVCFNEQDIVNNYPKQQMTRVPFY